MSLILSCIYLFLLAFSFSFSSHYLLWRQIGVGMCMEGIEQNPVVYELMSEMAFRNDPVHLDVRSFSSPTEINSVLVVYPQ